MSILKAIKRTTDYAKTFGCQLNVEEIEERLISDKVWSDEEIKNGIKTLRLDLCRDTSLDREAFKKTEKAEKLAKLISNNFKDILFMGITGSVAAGYPKINDDIDLIIITKINRLWINRLKLRFFILVNKIPHRKFGKREKKDDFCFNLWLDEKYLEIPIEKQNLQNAIDLILIKPLINEEKTYQKFILTNDWAKKYVATGYNKKQNPSALRAPPLDRGAFIFSIINFMVFWPQFWYMKNKKKKEKVDLHRAFFHH